MKKNIHSAAQLLFLLAAFLISNSSSSARKLAAGEQEKTCMPCAGGADERIKTKSVGKIGSIGHSFDRLMGLEECQNGDQECLKRRITAEAHLDYIYTQHYKP